MNDTEVSVEVDQCRRWAVLVVLAAWVRICRRTISASAMWMMVMEKLERRTLHGPRSILTHRNHTTNTVDRILPSRKSASPTEALERKHLDRDLLAHRDHSATAVSTPATIPKSASGVLQSEDLSALRLLLLRLSEAWVVHDLELRQETDRSEVDESQKPWRVSPHSEALALPRNTCPERRWSKRSYQSRRCIPAEAAV